MTGVTQSGRATPPLLKHLNERTILEAIRAAAPISRAEISRRAGISKPTVSLALRSLLRAGLVREAQRGPDGPSYGAVFFEPVPEAAYVLGLDLGARFLRGAVCDLAGEIRARQDVELRGADDVTAVGLRLTGGRDGVVATAGTTGVVLHDLSAVGIENDAEANPVAWRNAERNGLAERTRFDACNLFDIQGSQFRDDLTRRTGRETALVDDAERPVPLSFGWSLEALHELLERLVAEDQAPVYVVHFTQASATAFCTAMPPPIAALSMLQSSLPKSG